MFKVNYEKLKLYYERQKKINIKDFPDDLTIISNTCIGGRIYHDYHHKFLSPTIDFYMDPESFVEFCSNLKYYLNCEIKPLKNLKYAHLKGFLFCDIGGLTAAFSHTNSSYKIIVNKWNERKKRVNFDNIVVIATDRNVLTNPVTRCNDETIINFKDIPYKKIIFSIKDYDYDYVEYLPSFKNDNACPTATNPAKYKKGKYIIEEDGFDLNKFLCKKEHL